MRHLELAREAAARGAVAEVLALLCHGLQAAAAVVGAIEGGQLRVLAAEGPAPTPAPGTCLPLESSPWAAPLAGLGPCQGAALRIGEEVLGVLSLRRVAPLTSAEQAALQELAECLAPHVLAPWLRTRQRQAEVQAEQRLAELAVSLGHDLSSPIRHIRTLAAILREDGQVTAPAADGLERILGLGDQLSGLLERLRLYAHLQGGASSAQRVTLAPLLAERLAARWLAAPIILPAAGGLEPVVWGDPAQLALLVDELLDNAARFRLEGTEPQVSVHAHRLHIERAWVLSVVDQGIGLDMRYQDRIFQPLQRLHPSDRYPGHGLGLAICARIVRLHRGRIEVQSSPGEGACFTVTFPDAP